MNSHRTYLVILRMSDRLVDIFASEDDGTDWCALFAEYAKENNDLEKDMTTDNGFKVGDRVVLKRDFHFGDNLHKKGEVVTITKIHDSGIVRVEAHNSEDSHWICDYNLEPYDRKKEFISDLRELLVKYNASFSDYENYKVCFSLDDADETIAFNTEDGAIDADNIMDYEKE